jgi:hypothetical protein
MERDGSNQRHWPSCHAAFCRRGRGDHRYRWRIQKAAQARHLRRQAQRIIRRTIHEIGRKRSRQLCRPGMREDITLQLRPANGAAGGCTAPRRRDRDCKR